MENDLFKKTVTALDTLGVEYLLEQHRAIFTMQEGEELGLMQRGCVIKNLFLRDGNGNRHFLVLLPLSKKADLKEIQRQIGCTRISFASEQRLFDRLGLTRGSVSPLGILNDPGHSVELLIDESLRSETKLGIHPNTNTATVWLSFEALMQVIRSCGNPVHFISL